MLAWGEIGEELHEPLTTRLEKGHIYRIVGENGVGKHATDFKR